MARTEINLSLLQFVPKDWTEEREAYNAATKASGMKPASFAQRWKWLKKSGFIEVRVPFVAPPGSGLRNRIEVRAKPGE